MRLNCSTMVEEHDNAWTVLEVLSGRIHLVDVRVAGKVIVGQDLVHRRLIRSRTVDELVAGLLWNQLAGGNARRLMDRAMIADGLVRTIGP